MKGRDASRTDCITGILLAARRIDRTDPEVINPLLRHALQFRSGAGRHAQHLVRTQARPHLGGSKILLSDMQAISTNRQRCLKTIIDDHGHSRATAKRKQGAPKLDETRLIRVLIAQLNQSHAAFKGRLNDLGNRSPGAVLWADDKIKSEIDCSMTHVMRASLSSSCGSRP